MISAKEHIMPDGNLLLAACDASLVGKSFEEGELQLVCSKSFFSEKTITDDQLKSLLKHCTQANLMGEHTIAVALASGSIKQEHIKFVGGVPFGYLLKL